MPRMRQRFTKYQPNEVGEITGFSALRQRELRHRNLMPFHKAGAGWTMSDPFQLAALLTVRIASDLDIPLAIAKVIGEVAAPHVVFFAAHSLGGEAEQLANSEIGGAHRFVIFAGTNPPTLTSDIGAFFDDGDIPASIVIDLFAVAASLVLRTKEKPIVSTPTAATRTPKRD